ncbi:hypothetical protein Hanom_Chr04g00339671 [Helianthus anomalus]
MYFENFDAWVVVIHLDKMLRVPSIIISLMQNLAQFACLRSMHCHSCKQQICLLSFMLSHRCTHLLPQVEDNLGCFLQSKVDGLFDQLFSL